MEYLRLYQKDPLPTYATLRQFTGKAKPIFDALIKFLDTHYDFTREVYFGGKSFGVMIRYRKSGKTLIQIFPEQDGVAVVLIYGQKEQATFASRQGEFSPYLSKIFSETTTYHDGKWLLIRLYNEQYLPELLEMIKIKKKPK